MATTTIEVYEEDWTRLNRMKQPGDGFKDALHRALDQLEALEEQDTAVQPEEVSLEERRRVQQQHTAPEPSLDDVDLPGSGEVLEARKEAVQRLYQVLQEEGVATKQDFLQEVDPEAVQYDSEESFWSNCIKGRDALKGQPGVEPPPRGRSVWRFDEASV